jgi:hypothetical protein
MTGPKILDTTFSMAPTRVIVDGTPVQPPAPVAPAAPTATPVESPIRVILNGDVVDRAAVPLPAEPPMDEGLAQYLDEKGTQLEWFDAYDSRKSDLRQDWPAQKEAQAIFLKRWRLRTELGRLKLEPWEAPPMPPAPKAKP